MSLQLSNAARQLKIVFFGTPDFAVASLDALIQAGAQIVAVVTAPDKPAGRGMQLQASEVKKYALEKKLHILQPLKLKDPEFIRALQELQADIFTIVAFRMLPEVIWNMPPMGTINVHGSLLPQYRGAAPINHAVINGETETGVTTFRLKQEIDTGNILLQHKISIAEDETAGDVYNRLMTEGGKLLVATLNSLMDNSIEPEVQDTLDPGSLKHAPKIYKDDCRIDWSQSTSTVYNLVRGMAPYPTAFTTINGKTLKLFKVQPSHENHSYTPGYTDTDSKSYLRFACADGWIYVQELQLEGKKRMPVTEFLKGFRIA